MYSSHRLYKTHPQFGLWWCAQPSAPPEEAELGPRCINKCITLWVKWVPGDLEQGKAIKAKDSSAWMDLQPLPKAAGLVTPGAGKQQVRLRANQHSPGTWPHPPDPDQSKQIVWLGPAAGNQHKILLLSIRIFQPSFCTLVAQCNDWKGTFLKVSVKGSQAIKDSANSPLRLLNVTLYCFRGAKQPYLDQKHGFQVSRDKRPQH